jgi:hypothetical protein
MSKLLLGAVVGVFVAGFAAELVARKRRRGLPSFEQAAREIRRGFMEGFYGADDEPPEADDGA